MDGGAGTDDLYAVVIGSVTPAALKNIENVYITNTTTAATIDFSNATGLSTVTNSASTIGLTMSGIKSVSGPTVTVRDTAIAGQVVTFNDVTGTADSATIVISNVTGTAMTLEVAGVETLTLQPIGTTANVITTLTTAATTKLIVTGSAALNVGTLGSTVLTLDASTNTGTSNVGVTAVLSSTGANSITGGSANDAITVVSTGADSITMGAGNDTLTNVTGFNALDTINGGDGTDTLLSTSALIAAITATPTTYTVTNIETIAANTILATGQAFTPTNISATATRLNLLGAGSGAALGTAGDAYTVTGPAGAFTLGLGRSQLANTLGVLGAASTLAISDTGTATTDSITILNSAVNLTTGGQLAVFGTLAITSVGYETVTINNGTVGNVTQVLGAISVTGDSSVNTTLTLTGANTITTGAITATIIDASALTATGTAIGAGTAAFQMAGVNTATTITGSAGIDNLIGHASSATSITAGSGADSITAGSGNDTILGGAGNDSIVAGSGNDSINGGDDNDTITFAANLASGDVVDGGAGTDTLLVSAAIAAAAAATVTNVEIISFSATAAQDMTAFLNAGITTLGATAGALTVTNAQTTLTSLILGAAGASAVTGANLTRLVDGTADSLSVLLLDGTTGGTTLVTPSLANEETLTIGESGTDSTAAVTFALGTVTATSLTTLNISGSNNHTMTLSGETKLATVAASGATGTLSILGGNSAVNMTVTGPTATAMTIVTGSGNDSVTGGAAADILTGGTGNDTLIGGAGGDTLVNSAGIDSLVGGDGTDLLTFAGFTIGTTLDGGSTAMTGIAVNLSTSAILAATIAAHRGNVVVVNQLNVDVSTLAAGTATHLGLVNTVSARVDIVSGIEDITGTTGKDFIVGSSSVNSISGGTGADVIALGSGADTYLFAQADSIVQSGTTDANNLYAAGETVTFTNGVDVILSGFTAGASGDILNVDTTVFAVPTPLIAVANNALTTNTVFVLSGTYVPLSGIFTITAAGAGADTLMYVALAVSAVSLDVTTSTSAIVLIGVVDTALVAANFI